MDNGFMNKAHWKKIIEIAWPLIIANSFWNLQLTIDRVYLGNYSTEALGAVMTVMGVFGVPMALLQQTSSYITTFVAQYNGADQKEKIGEAIWQALFVAIVGGLLFLGLMFLSDWFFNWVGHSVPIQKLEVEYFDAIAYSALPTALVAVASGFYTGLGKTKAVIGINFVGLFFYVIIYYFFFFCKLCFFFFFFFWKSWFSLGGGGRRRLRKKGNYNLKKKKKKKNYKIKKTPHKIN